jgi:hypothetical protein
LNFYYFTRYKSIYLHAIDLKFSFSDYIIVITKLHVFVVIVLFLNIIIHAIYYSKIFIDKACDLILYGLSNNGTLDIIIVQDMQNLKGCVKVHCLRCYA